MRREWRGVGAGAGAEGSHAGKLVRAESVPRDGLLGLFILAATIGALRQEVDCVIRFKGAFHMRFMGLQTGGVAGVRRRSSTMECCCRAYGVAVSPKLVALECRPGSMGA